MRWTHKHTSIGTLAVAVAILAVATMNPVGTTPEVTGPIGSGLSINPSSENPTTGEPAAPSTTRPVITLGDLGPPSRLVRGNLLDGSPGRCTGPTIDTHIPSSVTRPC